MLTVADQAGLTILDVGKIPTMVSFTNVCGNGVSPTNPSSSLNLVSASLSLPLATTTTPGPNDVVVLANGGTITLPEAAVSGRGRYYIIRNISGGGALTVMNADASAILEKSKGDPTWFLMEVLGVPYLTPQQRDVIASVAKHRRTCVTAGNGVGKTWLAARLTLWFLYTNPQSKVVTTAPTWFQVENLLWRELRVAHQTARFPLGGTLNQTELNLSEDWYAVGLSTNDPTRFQGTHAPRIMVAFLS